MFWSIQCRSRFRIQINSQNPETKMFFIHSVLIQVQDTNNPQTLRAEMFWSIQVQDPNKSSKSQDVSSSTIPLIPSRFTLAMYQLNVVWFFFFFPLLRSQIYCSDFPRLSPDSEVKECHFQGNHSYECTFQPIFLLSGYTLWIEFKHFLGTLESSPTCVIPADVGRSKSMNLSSLVPLDFKWCRERIFP